MKKSKGFRLTLTGKLMILILSVVICAILAIAFMSYRQSSRALTKSVHEQLTAVAKDISHQIDSINKKELSTLRVLSEMEIFKSEDLSLREKTDYLHGVADRLGSKYENVAFYDAQGDAYTSDGRLINFAKRPYFYEAIAGKDYIVDPAFSSVTNSILQYYSVPVYSKTNKAVGVIVGVINGNALYDTIKEIDLGEGMTPVVVNHSNSTVVASVEKVEDTRVFQNLDKSKGQGLVISNILSGKTGVEDFVDKQTGNHMICAYETVENTDWTVCAVATYDYYFSSLRTFQIQLAGLFVISIIVAVIAITFFVRLLVKPLLSVKKSITTIATGNADLTQRIPQASNDEIGDVVSGFNVFVEKLQGIVKNLLESKNYLECVDEDLQSSTQDTSASIIQIISNIESVNGQIMSQSNSVQETVGAVNEISSNIESLERMIENHSACVTQASAAVEQMIGNINSVNTSVGKMIESFNLLQQNSAFGINAQNNANEKISMIEQQSKMLQDANTAIASIAEQTNLLAMNAAIEAAHAGEAGKGFSVVADEIRKLSETSTNQSKTIGAELNKIQDTIKEVVSVSSETNTAFSAVSQSISETSEIIQQIKGAMEEQQVGSKQIIQALQTMNNSTSEVKMASEEMTIGNKEILTEIEKLQSATDMIKGSVTEMHEGAKRINENGAALTEISGKVTESIKKISDEIVLFKV